MKKETVFDGLLIGLPALAIILASGEKSVRIFERATNTDTYQSYFNLLPENCFQLSTVLAMGLAIFAMIFGIAHMVSKDKKWFRGIYLTTFASVFAAEIPTLLQAELMVLPNILVPILLIADCAIAYSRMKKPGDAEKKKPQGQRLQPRR